MANEDQDMLAEKGWIMDRFTGRETNALQPDPKMTIIERMDRFLGAETELNRAEIALKDGLNKHEVEGRYEDIVEAVEILKASSEYHASQIDEQDLAQAVRDQDIPQAEADIVLERRAAIAANQSVPMSEGYYEDLEARLDDAQQSQEPEGQPSAQDEGQER